jgi:3-oxoacyl-[acyl-carrier-protein] synthase II
MNRIVITGMGLVTPLGCSVQDVWTRIIDGASGITTMPKGLAPDIAPGVIGLVSGIEDDVAGFDPKAYISPKELRKMDRFIQFAIVASDEAINQAEWHPERQADKDTTATVIASGVGGFPAMADATRDVEKNGSKRVSPFLIPSFLVNLAAGQISIRHGFGGPIGAPVTACAASAQSIGDGARLINNNEAEVVVCGGAEAGLDRVALAGFAAARALSSKYNERPSEASRPFDQGRDGFIMSEGAGIVVLETLDHAIQRGAEPLAELVGYGTSADAYHITSGPPDGRGAQRAMDSALKQAKLNPQDIDYINAHATSTPVGDAAEIAAIKAVFGEESDVAISSTKSAIGHTLGAAGAIEAIFSVMALRTGTVPPTLNLQTPDEAAASLNIVGPAAVTRDMTYALSNAFGFGGVNAATIFKKWPTNQPEI